MTRPITNRVQTFRGVNDRRPPTGLATGEFADSMNVELSQRIIEKRQGFERLGGPLRDGSLRLDGVNDYLRIANQTSYADIDTFGIYFGIGIVLRRKPASAVTVASWGFGSTTDLLFDLRYDPTAGTGSLGAWVVRVRNTGGGGSTITLTLDDGDGGEGIVGSYRYLEFYTVPSVSTTLKYWKADGTTASTTGSVISATALNFSSSQDLFIGVGTTALNTIGTDFIDATICEIRLSLGTAVGLGLDVSASNFYYKRELTPVGVGLCYGYWKLNDGGLVPECADSTTTNNPAKIVNNPATWLLKSQNAQVLGESALNFNGGNSWVSINDTDGSKVAATFTASSPNVSRWTVRGVLIFPALPAGQTTWPNGVVFWAGTSTTLPAPVNSGDDTLYPFDDLSRVKVKVHCAPLDTVDLLLEPTFIKMDIQGGEYKALLGMNQILSRGKVKHMAIEFYPEALRAAKSDPAEMLEFLWNHGFSLYEIHEGHGTIGRIDGTVVGRSDMERGYINLWCVRE